MNLGDSDVEKAQRLANQVLPSLRILSETEKAAFPSCLPLHTLARSLLEHARPLLNWSGSSLPSMEEVWHVPSCSFLALVPPQTAWICPGAHRALPGDSSILPGAWEFHQLSSWEEDTLMQWQEHRDVGWSPLQEKKKEREPSKMKSSMTGYSFDESLYQICYVMYLMSCRQN